MANDHHSLVTIMGVDRRVFLRGPAVDITIGRGGRRGRLDQGNLACPKHFAGYNQDMNRFGLDPARETVNINIDKPVLHELHMPAKMIGSSILP